MALSSRVTHKPNFLLIQPRWLDDAAVQLEIDALQQKYPQAKFTVLSTSRFATATSILLPASGRQGRKKWLSTIVKLRRRKFDEAIIVTEAHRTERGYFESKVWAFASRAKTRRLGHLKTLSLSDEFAPKFRLVLRTLVERALQTILATTKKRQATRKRRLVQTTFLRFKNQGLIAPIDTCPVCQAQGTTPVSPNDSLYYNQCANCESLYLKYSIAQQAFSETRQQKENLMERSEGQQRRSHRLQAFTYHNWHDKLFGNKRGWYLDMGDDDQYQAVARTGGWKIDNKEHISSTKTETECVLAESARYDFITSIDTLNSFPQPAHFFSSLKAQLAPGGICLLRVATADKMLHRDLTGVELNCISFPSRKAILALMQDNRLEVVEIEDSLFEDDRIEIWLRNKVDEDSN